MKLRCNKCNDVIEGDKKGTYIECKCGAIAIDETEYYYRVIGNPEDVEEVGSDNNDKEINSKDINS